MLDKPVYRLKEGSKLWDLHKIYEELEYRVEPTKQLGLEFIQDEKHFGFIHKPANYEDEPEAYKYKQHKYFMSPANERYVTCKDTLETCGYDDYKKLNDYLKLIYIRFYADKGSAFSPLFPDSVGENYFIGGDNVAYNEYLLESYEPISYKVYLEGVENG